MTHVPELLGVRELARRLSLSTSAVRRFAYRGQLPYVKIGTRLLFEPAAVEEFLQRHRQTARMHTTLAAADVRRALGIPAAERPRGHSPTRVEPVAPFSSAPPATEARAVLQEPLTDDPPRAVPEPMPEPPQEPTDPAQPFRDAFRKAMGGQQP